MYYSICVSTTLSLSIRLAGSVLPPSAYETPILIHHGQFWILKKFFFFFSSNGSKSDISSF